MTTLIVFSHLRWGCVQQRPQHLLPHLADRFRILFVEEPVHAPGPAHLVCVPQGPNLDVLVPHTPVRAEGFHDDHLPVLRPMLEQHLQRHGIVDPIVWFSTPMALPLIAQWQPRMVVYDCMDELAAFPDAPRQMHQRETALLETADVVLTGGLALYEAKRALHPHVHYLPSAVDAEHFAPRDDANHDPQATQAQHLLRDVPSPRLGYFGVIDERFDLVLLDALAAARPTWQMVMVGPLVKIAPGSLPRRPNIHWLGAQPYARLPHLLARWDLCVMPLALTEATRFSSPSEPLEFMAGEKPVVSTAVPDVVSLHGDVVRIARDTQEFIDACAASLSETSWQRSERMGRMVSTVHRSSWAQHGRMVGELIQAHLDSAAIAHAATRQAQGREATRARAVVVVSAPRARHGSELVEAKATR